MENERLAAIVRRRNPMTLLPAATVRETCKAMQDCRMGAIPVVDGAGTLPDIFTGRDAMCRVLAEGRSADDLRLAEVVTPGPATLPASKTAWAALRLMSDCGFPYLPIVEGGRLAGIVSHGDFRALQHARLGLETRYFGVLR